MKPGQLAAPSKSDAYRRAVDAMKAGVSPQEHDLKKFRKYMESEFTTNFKRKVSEFEKRKSKSRKKTYPQVPLATRQSLTEEVGFIGEMWVSEN